MKKNKRKNWSCFRRQFFIRVFDYKTNKFNNERYIFNLGRKQIYKTVETI